MRGPLSKPYRVAFLAPEVVIEGPDAVHAREAAALVWVACLELAQRHPALAVLDAEATPLVPQDGHYLPSGADRGASPRDDIYGPARRDELMWLEVALAANKPCVVRLRCRREGVAIQTFDADDFARRTVAEQILQVLVSWANARELGAFPRRDGARSGPTTPPVGTQSGAFRPTPNPTLPPTAPTLVSRADKSQPITTIPGTASQRPTPNPVDDFLATVRIVAPLLAEQARQGGVNAEADDEPLGEGDDHAPITESDDDDDELDGDAAETSLRIDSAAIVEEIALADDATRKRVRNVANRLPASWKVAALRVLELALREDQSEAILALDPDHPQALFRAFERDGDPAKLRRVLASAPGWAKPYLTLGARGAVESSLIERQGTLARSSAEGQSSLIERVAGAAVAAVCRPASLDVIDASARRLADAGRADDGVRLLERVVRERDADPRTHLALLDLHAAIGREGARLQQASRSARRHGCPMDPGFPWYPDQIHVDLRTSSALLGVGRLDEAIALRANRLEGRESAWPHHARLLSIWRKDPRFVAWCYAREGAFRGDDARAVEGFGRVEPADAVDLAIFLDALVALGREDEVLLAWSQFGPPPSHGAGGSGPPGAVRAVARMAAARALMAAGEWRRGLEEMWRVSLCEPGRDEHVAIARCGLYLSCAPAAAIEAALAERLAIGAPMLAKRMARDVADFTPASARSSVVARALGKTTSIEYEPSWLAGFAPDTRSKRAIDALFAELGAPGADRTDLARADQLVNRWLEVVFTEATEDDPGALAQAAAYAASHALARYLALTTQAPTVHAGALRTVAGEALALVRKHRLALGDRDARAVLAAIDPPLRRADRWVGITWLGTVERSLELDERSAGDLPGFASEQGTVASRLLGPEEAAMLAWSVARLHRERPDGWAAACTAQAMRLAMHTGRTGVDEWADAVATQHAARAIDLEDALDQLHTACYLAEGASPVPCVHAAQTLFAAGRAAAAVSVLCTGLGAATTAWRDANLGPIAEAWNASKSDMPYAFDKLGAGMFEALSKGDPARAEKLGRWAVAFDPGNAEAHRNLGLALAQQNKVADAMRHLMRGAREQATQILSGVLYQSGKLAEAMQVLDYASRWYTRADQWLSYGGVAYAAMDNPRTVKAYRLAYQLEPAAFDTTQLNAFAGVLDEVGDYATCERIADELLKLAGDDLMWKTNAWNHLACASIGMGRFDEAVALAERAAAANPLPDNRPAFAATLERARTKKKATPPELALPGRAREPVFALLEDGDIAGAMSHIADPSWRVRRAALGAMRYRYASENQVEVTARARAVAVAVLAETVGLVDRDAVVARALAMQIREQAYFARDPVPQLGDRMTRAAFYVEFRARGGVVLGEAGPAVAAFVDRIVVPTSRIARAADYVALLRDLAALDPRDALVQFGLDDAGYLEVARAWAAALDADPSVAVLIAAGLARA